MKNVPIFQKIFQHMFTNEIEEDLIMFSVFSQQEPNNFILSILFWLSFLKKFAVSPNCWAMFVFHRILPQQGLYMINRGPG